MTNPERNQRQTALGVVENGPFHKTISVRSQRLVQHAKYLKYVRATTLYRVHDEKEEARIGDTVEIAEARPISKTKHWRLVRVVNRSKKAIESEAQP